MITSAFTCTGPYAVLIMLGIKRVENRSMMPEPVKGRCAVGCAKSFCREEFGNFVQGEASCAGLAPDGVYVYAEWGEGRANRPPCTGSTVAPTVTARWKATSTATHTATSKTSGAEVSFLIYYRT